MRFSQILSTAVAGGVATAEPLANVLAANNNTLSTLNSILAGMPQFTQAMKALPDISKDKNMVTALLQYHVMSGVMMSTAFTETPQFVSTFMGMPFSMVTGNQKVELVKMENKAMIFSGFKQMSSVTKADVAFDGGVVHVIDKVLTTYPDVPVLTSLAGALTKTNMVTAVDSVSDVTIFAPSNKAFENIGSAAESASVMDLSTILSYHVLHGGDMAMFSTNLLMGSSAMEPMPSMANMPMRRQAMESTPMKFATLQGGDVNVRMENGKVFVNSAQVTTADIIVSNGVIHLIDKLLPFPGPRRSRNPLLLRGIMPTTTIMAGGMTGGAGVFASMPTAAILGAVGGAAFLAGL
ncbi:beta-Ig-H3/fasciclin [Diaporthe helianthi]|uniref:Beta-Ig-H3/fasciclin n=1 Tax=Diaporthe helianthi TaxID=158607 RepID=A0A2P5I133_DIAHE|nr:beta-Ig-H3/fasciclin [Diaporthe helianthi]